MTTDIRFNASRIRRFGLSSTQEAKILLFLSRRGRTERKALARVFDLRLVERLALLGLVEQAHGEVALSESGRQVLERCLEG